MPIKIRHLKNQRRGTGVTSANIPIDEARDISEGDVKKALISYYPKATIDYSSLAYEVREFVSGENKENTIPISHKEGSYLSLKKVKGRILITPTPVLHDIRIHPHCPSQYSHETLLSILEKGFQYMGTGYDNANVRRKREGEFTGWGLPSKKNDITKGDICSIELFTDKASEDLLLGYHVEKASPERILSVNIKLNPDSSEEEKENKMQFYKKEIAEKYHVPVKYFVATQEDKKVSRRIFPKQKSLEQKVTSVIAIAGFMGSLIFLQSKVTGNAIGNLSQSSGSWIGIVLLFVGIAGALFYFRSKKR